MVNKAIVISDELINISDTQLAKRLKDEFNFNCGPITDTTKNIYLKKLQEFIDNSGNKQTAAKSTPIKNVKLSTPKTTRRKTIATPIIDEKEIEIEPPKQTTRRASVGRGSPRGKNKPLTKQEIKPSITNFSDTETEDFVNDKPANTSINGQTALEYSRGSRLLKRSFNNRISSVTSPAVTRSASLLVPNTLKETKTSPISSANDSYSSDESFGKKSGGIGFSTKPINTPTSVRTFKLFNRASVLSNFSDSESEETNNLNDDLNKKEPASSFTDTITKRLLRHRPKPTLANSTSKTLNKDNYLPSKYLNNQQIVTQVNQSNSSETTQLVQDSITSQPNWISYAILIAGILFFAFIFSFYFYSRYFSAAVSSVEEAELNALEKEFDFSIHDLTIPNCSANDSADICSPAQMRPVLLIIKEMKKIVDKKLTHHYCSSIETNPDNNPYEYNVKSLKSQIEMSIGGTLVEMVRSTRSEKTKPTSPGDIFLSLFAKALKLLENNSKWYMRLVGERIVVDENYPKTLNTTCRVKLFMIKTLWYFITLIVLSSISILIYLYVKYAKNQTLKEKELLFDWVEKSIEILQSPDEPQSLPILNIRDMLLNPQQREEPYYQKVWDKVVHFIENNESRIKSSLENIDGEDYKTWKWVATIQPDSTTMKNNINNQTDYNMFSDDNTTNTTIQSPEPEKASRTINTSTPIKNNKTNLMVNSAQLKDFVALTRFLKVRNVLLDSNTDYSNDDWKLEIRNEIISRCCKLSSDGKTHGIQHIHVDDSYIEDSTKPSGIVYVKCDSTESATNAFKALHHSTFNNDEKKLIFVKFIKDDRYYHRFPEAINCTRALRIDNN